jgi:glycosyltransferase involved in cell wall biosynthesis
VNRIIIITHEFYPFPGGIAVYVCEMAKALAEIGRQVEIWCPAHPRLSEQTWPFTIVPIPSKGTQDWADRRKTARLWRQRADDIRNATVWLPEPGAILTAFYRGLFRLPFPKRLVLTLHGSEILNFTRSCHRRFLFNKLLAQASAVGVVSQFNKNLLLKRTSVAAEKVLVTPGALRTDMDFAPLPSGQPSPADFTILNVARIHPRKGQLLLLEAVAKLPESLQNRVRVKFVGRVGKPAYQKQLEGFAARTKFQVEFMGEKHGPELLQVYSESTLFALTSLYMKNSFESFGLVYLEAGACGLPVVAYDTGGVSEAVLDGRTGILVKSGDQPALTSALRKLLESPELLQQMGTAGREHARSFSWKQNVTVLFGEK